jgi:hypothetical protein
MVGTRNKISARVVIDRILQRRIIGRHQTPWNRDPLFKHVVGMVEKYEVGVQVSIAALEDENRLNFNKIAR